jgi:hypothetical protein
MILNEPITEEWLKEVGFKWHQFDRQPDKQWLLWLGDHTDSGDTQALGIELTVGTRGEFWFCWLRSDTSHRYSRFLHIRHMKVKGITYLTPLEGNERCQSILNTNVGVADQVLTSMSASIAAGMASLATIAAKTPVAAQMAMWITWFAKFAEEAEPLGAACLAKNGARRILYPVGKTPGAPPLNRLALRREFDWQKGLKYISPKVKGEVIRLIVALTDSDWKPENHIGGSAMTQKRADSIRADYDRLDRRIVREGRPWRDIEKDDSRGGALPEHMQGAIDGGKAQ